MTALAMLAGSSAWAADTTRVYAINTDSELTSAQLEKENAANEAYTNLLESFRATAPAVQTRSDGRENANMSDEASTTYTVDGIPAGGFPDYYAGAYMNANHELVVMMTDNAAASKSAVRSLSQSSELNFRTAEHSYADLVRCMDEITQGWSSGSAEFAPIQYAYIDDFGNRVVVGVKELSDEYLELLRARLKYFDAMVFTECGDMAEAITPESTTVNCNMDNIASVKSSNLITCSSVLYKYGLNSIPSGSYPSEQFSFGFKAKRTTGGVTQYGFVTAGHAMNKTEFAFVDSTNPNYECIGECVLSTQMSTYQYDAAFVSVQSSKLARLSSTFSVNGGLNRITSTSTRTAAQGSTIYKCGGKTNETYGPVLSSSFSLNAGTGISYMDVGVAAYFSKPGDSGGLVYSVASSTAYPVGIHVAKIPAGIFALGSSAGNDVVSDEGNFKIYCKIRNVLGILNVSLTT